MGTDKGWIKLYRNILEHWVYDDPLLLKIWLTAVLLANHDDRKIMINGKTVTIHRGQFWTSIRKFSMRVNMGVNTVHRKLDILQKDDMLFVDSRKGIGTLITVRNYALYQDFQDPKKHTNGYTNGYTDGYNYGTQSDTQVDHKQELKNYKNDKELKNNGLPPDHPDYFEEI